MDQRVTKRKTPRRRFKRRVTISTQNGSIAEATLRELNDAEYKLLNIQGIDKHLHWCALDEVWVSTMHRRQGLGRRVVQQALELARDNRRHVACRVAAHGQGCLPQPQLQAFYRSLGLVGWNIFNLVEAAKYDPAPTWLWQPYYDSRVVTDAAPAP